jgi:hypothetical protein
MPVRLALFALLVGASASLGAELRTLKGETLKGELVSIDDKQIVIATAKEKVATPLNAVLQLDLGPAGKNPPGPYTDVELTDGTLLHCASYKLIGKEIELKTTSGQALKLPLKAVYNILTNAHEEKNRREWSERLSKRRKLDTVTVLRDGTLRAVDGTLGDADDKGETIELTISGAKRPIPLANLHGLIFIRPPDPSAPPVKCKLFDAHNNLVMVSGVTATPAAVAVTTPAGAKFEFAMNVVFRLDYSTDKLRYLSDLDPVRVDETSTEDAVWHYKRDRNQDGGPIRLGSQQFPKGLSLHAKTELEYDLKGEFREFKATVGVNQLVGGIDGPVNLTIELDGQKWKTLTFTRKDKKQDNEIAVNVKDVQKLKIIVSSGDLFDLGKHLDLGDARVMK